MINRKELIKKYLDFFKSKKHKIIPNASLIPENDPTTLFISAGMQSLVPYLLGQKHPSGKRLCNVQRCIRTGDINMVGDETHHTFFEMLGNWSLGDYWKKETIEYSFEFLTKILKIPKEKLAVTIFDGRNNSENFPKELDEESEEKWLSLKIPQEKIAHVTNNWWGPAGQKGPCGPDTEMFYWKSKKIPTPKDFDLNNENWVEIWNDVLMQYNKDEKGNYNLAKQKNIDTGMGVERTLATLNNLEDNYLTECFKPIIEKIEKLSGKKYGKDDKNTRDMRIIADHIKAAVFILAEGITPSNTEQGYVLRRLIRRAIVYAKKLKIKKSLSNLVNPICKIYPEYKLNSKKITQELNKEEEKFEKTLDKGLKELNKMVWDKTIPGKNVFLLYQSYGFPIEMTKELALEWGSDVDEEGFKKELKKHQELSRTASAGKFKSGLADNSKATTKLHTAAHLLLSALRIILKDKNIIQKGSNITSERLRLDFSFPRKLAEEEIKEVEDLVNAQIQKSCEVIKEEMSPKKAKGKGALGIFDEKYGNKVSVYTIGINFSKEICAGPHVKNTCKLGKFKIKKETSSSSGVRRIKAILE